MTFDADTYEREVLKPLRSSSGKLPEDLLIRYGMDAPLSGADLSGHLKSVRSYWNAKSGGVGNLARLCQALRSADERLKRTEDLTDPRFWIRVAGQQRQRAADLVADLAADLKRRYSGVITRQQIDELPGRYRTLTEEQRREAVKQAELRVITALELPVECGLSDSQLRELAANLALCGRKTVVDLLIPEVNTPYLLLNGLRVPGSPSLKLGKAVVNSVYAEAEAAGTSAHDQARRSAVRMIRHAVNGGADPVRIAVAHIVHVLSGNADERHVFTASEAKDLGLHEDDAEALALTLETHRAARDAVGPDDVTRLLSQGRLWAARQALQSMTGTATGYAEAKDAVEAAQRNLDSLLERASGVEGPRFEQLLRRAAAIACDDDTIVTMLARLPPPAVVDFDAAATGVADSATVSLKWSVPPTGFPDLVYRVVRTVAVNPHGPNDGEVLGDVTALRIVDANPRPGLDLRYTVFVTGGDPDDAHAVWSKPVTVSVDFLPPVGDVRATAAGAAVELSWRVHSAAARVSVHRRLGSPPVGPEDGEEVPAALDGCVDDAATTEQRCFYAVTARYPGRDGTEASANPVIVEATAHGGGAALLDWTAEPVLEQDTVKVRLSWPADAGEIRVYRSDRLPTAEPGVLLRGAALNRLGAPVPGSGRVRGDSVELIVPHQTARPVFVPVTITADAGVMGRPRRVEVLATVTGLTCERRGDDLLVSWVWPKDAAMAEVTLVPDGFVRRITKSRYVTEGGCLLPASATAVEVEVRTVASRTHGTSRSPAAAIPVEAMVSMVGYRVERAPRSGLIPNRRRWRVTVSTDAPCPGTEVLIVAVAGTVMPTRPDPARILHRQRLDSGAGETYIDVTVPPELGKRYWLRCFLAEGTTARIQDPPLSSLKVG